MRICVTGATGSFGRAFIRTVLPPSPYTTVVALARDEVKMAALQAEWPDKPGAPGARLRCFLGDVRDRTRLAQAFLGCQAVVHAAALKRADLTAYSPDELLQTNVLGTLNVTHAAVESKVPVVVVLSSDKSPEPRLPYGVSKAMAEFLAIQANTYSYPQGTRVVVTRYGNVAFSRGSVLGIWRQRLNAGEALTLTESYATRFWMTLGQAVRLVQVSIQHARGGEIVVPAMKAATLLETAIAMGGPDVEVTESGFRVPSEKMHEVLALAHEMERALAGHDPILGDYYVIPPATNTWGATFEGARVPVSLRRRDLTSQVAPRFSASELRNLLAVAEKEAS